MLSQKSHKTTKIIILILLAVLLVLSIVYVLEKLVDIWWYGALGYEFYFWQRLFYRYAVFIGVTLMFSGFFFLNLHIASRVLRKPVDSADWHQADLPPSAKWYHRFRTGSLIVSIPLALGLAILVAMPLFRHWELFLFYLFGPGAGVNEPVFGKDVAYFLFSFPIYRMLQPSLLGSCMILFLGLSLQYWTEQKLLARQDRRLPAAAKWHLSFILLIIFLIESWDFILQRNELVYRTGNAPLFFGPGFIDMNFTVPLIWLQLAFLTASIFCLLLAIHYNNGFKWFAGLLVGFFIVVGARHAPLLPELIKKYIVNPNEFTREEPFIANNIQSTLQAYRLDNVEVRHFSPERVPAHYDDPQVKSVLDNIPLWENHAFKPLIEQLQDLRPYYTFSTVTVDRYTVNGKYAQVLVGPRELDSQNLPANANNWINRHLTYTHGYGAAMAPANQGGGEPMAWFMHDIPILSDYGMTIQQPEIYYGLKTDSYVIAPNSTGEMGYPKGNDNVTVNYQGEGGVPFSSLLRRMVFSWHFKDRNLLFTTRTTDQSKILFRRNITARIQTLTPFLMLDSTPYMVATSKGIFWIQDAYTTSNWYPDAAPIEFKGTRLNYIRNSVKIVVDAFNGTVDYYIFDTQDPIVRAYDRIYPGLLKDKAEMPADIREHIRYPRDFFDIQMRIYTKYHQTDPKVFYQQEDVWAYAEVIAKDANTTMQPRYMTLNLFQPDKLDFLLLMQMSPKGNTNLRSMAFAGCDVANYGKIVVYDFPKGELVFSPTQTYAIINEDPDIANQFTLWDQSGSKIIHGRVSILPIGRTIFYIQPIFLKSSYEVQIPELQRIIVSEGQVAVMEPSIEEAYKKLLQKTSVEMEQLDNRYPVLAPGNR
ncbi:UPF0182 family protein [Desulfosarcina ovata]|uniref:UPF0182 protein DSCOOX_62800 n=1 Tax=Desulfosarcina ovata subsp. ovata TaxID=2752305 RepID=A0A5K8AMM5_9BACT|nr:UPF0182 family protein [Desulfosarcina ovata]BBO93100.1 UPF0182 protein [Desulfosarcina ovata subsp. ovata]